MFAFSFHLWILTLFLFPHLYYKLQVIQVSTYFITTSCSFPVLGLIPLSSFQPGQFERSEGVINSHLLFHFFQTGHLQR